MNCLNIIQIVTKIKDSKWFDKLVFFIPTIGAVLGIPKTMVFANSLNKRIILANYLHNLLSVHMKKDGEKLIQIFNSRLELDTKA